MYDPDISSPEYVKRGIFWPYLDFYVSLGSLAKDEVTLLGTIHHLADTETLNIQKFVLEDDQGHLYGVVPSQADLGVLTRPMNVSTEQLLAPTSFITDYDFAPHAATVNEADIGTVANHTYRVRFPLFSKDGKAVINRNCKKIELHMISESGEQVVEYIL